jgi:1,6-anhydro-N-acetylmuramate kinase
VDKHLKRLKEKDKRIIVGIETGNTIGRFGAVLAEISGKGDSTILQLRSFMTRELPQELKTALEALDRSGEFDSEESAGINFLVLHQLVGLFQEISADSALEDGEVDVIGLKCMEISGKIFPEDPGVLSDMTGCAVASRFRIGSQEDDGGGLQIRESILQGMVDEMIEKFGLDKEAREAVAVALLANESIHHDPQGPEGAGTGASAEAEGPGLYAEFFFPD